MAHTNLALVLVQKGKIDDGISHYRSALQMQPDSWDAEYNLGTALLRRGQVDEAIQHCERAVVMRPTDPDAQVSLGDALLRKGRIDDAIDHYQKAMMARPDHFLSRYGLCQALLEKGELDSAIQVCRVHWCSGLWMQIVKRRWRRSGRKGNPRNQHYEKRFELDFQQQCLPGCCASRMLQFGVVRRRELAKQADVGRRLLNRVAHLAAAYAENACNSRACKARTLSRRISLNRSRCTDSGCRTGTRRNNGEAR
jgi:tetratricopeptide (TPR) repeat protein